jgi:CRISPR system Cascade subunit CasE
VSAPKLSRALLRVKPARGWTPEYITHQLVADLFGQREDRGYLYRVIRERPGGVEALVLSAASPLPVERIPVRDWGSTLDLQSKEFTPPLEAGQQVDFEVRVNATQVVTDTAGKKRRTDLWEAVWKADKQTPLTPHEVYGEYLRRKLEAVAEVASSRITERGEMRARGGDRREAIRFVAVNLIGTLRVIEPRGFLELVTAGIGREKAFGCGLLCLSAPGTVLPRRHPEAAGELY